MQSKDVELLQKLKKLAKQGVGGEALNAESLLAKMLKQYNLTANDLLKSEKESFCFEYKNKREQQLFVQLVYYLGLNDSFVALNKQSKIFTLSLLHKDYLQLDYHFNVYKKDMAVQLKNLFKQHRLEKQQVKLIKANNFTNKLVLKFGNSIIENKLKQLSAKHKKENSLFLSAFINKNNLFPKNVVTAKKTANSCYAKLYSSINATSVKSAIPSFKK